MSERIGTGVRVLVCGGRDYGYRLPGAVWGTFAYIRDSERITRERKLLAETLSALTISVLIHGAARGADEIASLWAQKNSIPQETYAAQWYPNGRRGGLDKSAGPRRNQRMLDEGNPDLVIAFAGGRGTADMVRRARLAGIEVIEIAEPGDG